MTQHMSTFIAPFAARVNAPHKPLQARRAPRSLPARAPRAARTAVRMSSSEQQPESREDAKATAESSRYWQGEWICVDCGYTYKPGRRVKFEDLPASWKCPQCNAPKRRFAKKAGDYIAETAGTSNLPIVIFSVVGLVATVLFGIWATNNL